MIKHSLLLSSSCQRKRKGHIYLCAKGSCSIGPVWILKLGMERLAGEIQTVPLGYVLLSKVN